MAADERIIFRLSGGSTPLIGRVVSNDASTGLLVDTGAGASFTIETSDILAGGPSMAPTSEAFGGIAS